jgi:hypothetical protein
MVAVRFKDGREVKMQDRVARKMASKGKIVILPEGQTVHAGREKFSGFIAAEKAEALGVPSSAPVAEEPVREAAAPEPMPDAAPAIKPARRRRR